MSYPAGFLVEEESIDEDEQSDATKKYVPSQTIDVYDHCSGNPMDCDEDPEIGNDAIWDVVKPWVPKITQIVKDNRNKEGFSKFYPDDPDREPELNWIFFRMYSPKDERNSLKHHHDTNMNTGKFSHITVDEMLNVNSYFTDGIDPNSFSMYHTYITNIVNIELSNDYEGGGLFYIKPLASTGEIDEKYSDTGYEWVDTIKRGNTSDIAFPDLHAGDAIFYNYTVEHGVAPVESGKRVSINFFSCLQGIPKKSSNNFPFDTFS